MVIQFETKAARLHREETEMRRFGRKAFKLMEADDRVAFRAHLDAHPVLAKKWRDGIAEIARRNEEK